MIDLSDDAGVRTALRAIADWYPVVAPDGLTLVEGSGRPAPRRHRRLPVALIAAAVALVVAGIVVLAGREPDPAMGALTSGRWSAMAGAPIEPRIAPSWVWSGDELFVWGGSTSTGDGLTDGAAYDPATDTWRRIASMPGTAIGQQAVFAEPAPSAVVAGTIVTVRPLAGGGIWDWELLTYDIEADRWTVADTNRYDQLPTDVTVPTEGRAPLHDVRGMTVWDGKVVALGWRSDLNRMAWATYDVTSGRWSEAHPVDGVSTLVDDYGVMPLAPLAPPVDGRLLVVTRLNRLGVGAFEIDLATDAVTVGGATLTGVAVDASMDASGLVVGIGTDDDSVGSHVAARFDAAAGMWLEAAAPTRGPATEQQPALVAVPGGHVLIGGIDVGYRWGNGLEGGPVALAADETVTRWAPLPRPPFDLERVDPIAVWTGNELIVWGGAAETPGGSVNLADRPLGDGGIYRLGDG